jgi:hypothetical protein
MLFSFVVNNSKMVYTVVIVSAKHPDKYLITEVTSIPPLKDVPYDLKAMLDGRILAGDSRLIHEALTNSLIWTGYKTVEEETLPELRVYYSQPQV